mmetsp:Transcript_20493/g.78731  ORF Transcript_20493/g.78731 Transcript_20493/m.78731 type:complete len:215 (-) Transcript_20493:140-784(-)
MGAAAMAAPAREKALWEAASHGNVPEVVSLLDSGAMTDWANDDAFRSAPLAAAVRHGRDAVVRVLLDRGANPEAKDTSGYTAVMVAVVTGQLDLVSMLLDAGADIEATNDGRLTPLLLCMVADQDDVARHLIDRGANVDAKDSGGHTPLIWAALRRNSAMVRLLLERGADASARESRGMTALSTCRNDECRAVLRRVEPLQRWHRRRLLALWRR